MSKRFKKLGIRIKKRANIAKSIAKKFRKKRGRKNGDVSDANDTTPEVNQDVNQTSGGAMLKNLVQTASDAVGIVADKADTGDTESLIKKDGSESSSPADAQPKPTAMDWLKKNWYIPVGALMVIGGIIVFLKRKK